MKNKKTYIAVIVAVVVLLILFFIFHRSKTNVNRQPIMPTRDVTITTIQKKDVNDYYEAAGTIQAKTISVISSRVMGSVTEVLVKQGDKVAAGQVLLTIDDNDLAQGVRAAEASYNEALKAKQTAQSNKALAETTFKRYKQLYDQKALSGQEMDQITNQWQRANLELQRSQSGAEAAQANLSQAKINLDYARITSPIDGVVTHKNIDKGSMATPGTPLITVEDNAGFKAEAAIDESMAGDVNVSMPVEVAVDSISRRFKGVITEIVPSIDASSRTFFIKALITKDPNDNSLTNGLYARVLIRQKTRSILAVPEAAIILRGQLVGVYVIGEKNRLTYRMIRTGKIFDGEMEVLSGLSEGERIISAGANNVSEGETIESGNY